MAAGFLTLSPPDNSVFSATRPAVFIFGGAGGLALTTSTCSVNGVAIATTALQVVTSLSNDYVVTVTQPGGAGPPATDMHYNITPVNGWTTSPATAEVDGLLTGTPFDQSRTLTVGDGYISNHTETALGRMLEQFRGSVNLRALASAFVDQAQAFEDVAIQLIHDRNLDTATGHRLDGLGQIAGVSRGGRDDETYRRRLQVEFAILRSQGSIEDMIEITQLLVGGTPDILVDEYYPKALYLRAQDYIVTGDATEIGTLLRRAASAATNLQFVYSQTEIDDDDLFRFSDTNGTSETSSSHGYSNGTYTGAK